MRSLSALLLLCGTSLFSQSTFQRVFDCESGNMGDVVPITGGGAYVTYGIGQFDLLGTRGGTGVVKYDSNFDPVWNNVYSTSTEDEGMGLLSSVATADGGLALAGNKSIIVTDTAMMVKLNSSGEVVWAKDFPSPLPAGAVHDSFSRITDIKEASNGDLVVVGNYSYFTDDYFTRVFVARLSATGTVLWTRSLAPATTPNNWNSAASITVLAGGGLLVTANTEGDTEGAWIGHLQDNGTLDWAKKFNTNAGSLSLRPVAAFKTGSGYDYFLSTGYGAGSRIMCTIRTDANGTYMSSKTYAITGGTASAWDVVATASGYAVVGFTGYLTPDDYDANMLLIKVSATGAVEPSASFGSTDQESAQHVALLPDGSFLMAGAANYIDLDGHRGGTPPQPMLIRTDASLSYLCGAAVTITANDTAFTGTAYTVQQENVTGWLTAQVETSNWLTSVAVCGPSGIAEESASPITVAPNPASSSVSVNATVDGPWNHELIDLTGRVLLKKMNVRGIAHLDVSAIATGRYLLRSTSGQRVRTTSLVIMH